jgi:predicted O-linked N-acetylglucosamine transferase (SPINDLY family)
MHAGRFAEALALIEEALTQAPRDADLHYNAGQLAVRLNDPLSGIKHFREAIKASPERSAIHAALGHALVTTGALQEAKASLNRALEFNPDNADALCNLGGIMMQERRLNTAIELLRRSVAIAPGLAIAHLNLGASLFGQGRISESIGCFRAAIAHAPELPEPYSNLLKALAFVPGVQYGLIAETTRRWGRLVKRPAQHPGWSNTREPERRLRIGYVSPDLRDHPVAYFLESVLEAHDPNSVELVCYSSNEKDDDATERFMALAPRWRRITRLTDAAAAALVREDGIDILVDLSGHTTGQRLELFALKPAPVQCTWIGYYATTGLPEIDYIFADRIVLPPGEESFYVEKPWRMPDSYLCFTPPAFDVEIGPLPAERDGTITFGSCNNVFKVNRLVVAAWSRLLHAYPKSRLLLRSDLLSSDEIREELGRQFAEHGLAPERLTLLPFAKRPELMATYNDIDIALDPFPYGGGTTTVEALWMGVPVVSRRGDRFSGRVSDSVLTTVGLPELVVTSEDDYIAKAIALAEDRPRLAELRRTLRRRVAASPLCDAKRFTRHLEQAYRSMWRGWCTGKENAA